MDFMLLIQVFISSVTYNGTMTPQSNDPLSTDIKNFGDTCMRGIKNKLKSSVINGDLRTYHVRYTYVITTSLKLKRS
jgi:hypothetical protein